MSALNPLLIRTWLSRATATELLQTLADVAIRVAGKRMDVQEEARRRIGSAYRRSSVLLGEALDDPLSSRTFSPFPSHIEEHVHEILGDRTVGSCASRRTADDRMSEDC